MERLFKEQLNKGIEELGLQIDQSIPDELVLYFRELKRWSRAYNLTGLKDEKDILTRLFLDSLLYLRYIPSHARRVLDVGSGAGFPGLVIKLARKELDVILLEPSWKKASFLNHMVKKLNLRGTVVIQTTLEEFSRTFDNKGFHVITTKALFKTAEFVKKAGALLDDRGIILLSKGRAYEEELQDFNNEKRLSSLFTVEISSMVIPLTDIKRYFLIVKKKD